MYRLFVSVTALLALLVWSSGEASTPLPFQRHGIIDRLNAHQGLIVINDATYSLAPTAKVHFFARKAKRAKEQETEPADGNPFLLRPGMHIGYRVEGEGPGRQGRLVEAWILPPDTIPQSRN